MTLIIGAGLSGLITAYRLKKEGIPFKILEARDRIGGRINTSFGTNNTPMEMGATWFNSQHTNLIALLEDLEIAYFKQHMEGTVFFQPFANTPAQAIKIPAQAPSYRIAGGTGNLINSLYKKLDKEDIEFNQTVKEIKILPNSVQLFTDKMIEAEKVVLALPPKLWAKNILFQPELPTTLKEIAEHTHTWMEDSIKIALSYSKPFWEEEKLSGALFSNEGPITEFYDHCNYERSKFALCGFMHPSLNQLNSDERRNKVLEQLKTVFGAIAEDFIDYEECIWSSEEYTFEKTDIPLYPHQNNGNKIFRKTFFEGRLIISSSESASEFPGYMEGAVISGFISAQKIAGAK